MLVRFSFILRQLLTRRWCIIDSMTVVAWSPLSGLVLFVVAIALLVVTARLVASAACVGGAAALPAMYVVAFAEVVFISLLCSSARIPIPALTYLVGELCLAVGALLVQLRAGGSLRPPSIRGAAQQLRRIRRMPVVLLVFAVAVGVLLAYELALAVFTEPNNFDSLWYHLARAAFWYQKQRVSYIANPNSDILNVYPPNGEILSLYGFTFLHSAWAAALSQFVAQGALLVCVGATARRLGYSRAASLFAALLTATLPIIALESVTTQNDLIVASLVSASALFLLRGTRWDMVFFALASGLAIGTKFTAFLAVPPLLSRRPRRRGATENRRGSCSARRRLGAVGLVWLHPEHRAHRDVVGGSTSQGGLTAHGSVFTRLGVIAWIVYRFCDLSGAQGLRLLAYLAVGVIVAGSAALLVVGSQRAFSRKARTRLRVIITAAVLALAIPLLTVAATRLVGSIFQPSAAPHSPHRHFSCRNRALSLTRTSPGSGRSGSFSSCRSR